MRWFNFNKDIKMKTRKEKDSASTATKKNKPNLSIKIPEKSPLEQKIEKYKRDILGFRTTNEQLFIKDHKINPYKTAMLINQDKLSSDVTFANEEKLNTIPSHRPIKRISRKSRTNSPVAVQTPKGTILPRVTRCGVLSLFSNDPNAKPVIDFHPKTKLINETKFYASEAFDSIKESESNSKAQSTTITHKQLEKRRMEDLKNKFRRSISQNKIMAKSGVPERKGSATDYTLTTKLFDKDLRWEWLHLVAHMINGANSQDSENLVAGTAYANTEMMFAEATLNYLARVYPDGFNLSVRATLIPGTHIATAIYYMIKTPDFEIPFEFNTQTSNRPHINFQSYYNYLIEELVRSTHQSKKNDVEKNKQIITYSKDKVKNFKIPTVSDKEPGSSSIAHAELKDRPERKVIIDTETTGLFVDQGDRVCEIAGVEIINGKPTGKEFKKIINPERSIPKKLNNEGIHHITDAVVKGKPTFKEVADEFCEFIKNAEIIGHNLPFDITMLENEFKLAGRKDTLINRYATDTLAQAQKLLPKKEHKDLHSHKLDDLCDYYKINAHARDNGHDALIDSRLTGKLYLRLLQEEKKHNKTNPAQLFSKTKKSLSESSTETVMTKKSKMK